MPGTSRIASENTVSPKRVVRRRYPPDTITTARTAARMHIATDWLFFLTASPMTRASTPWTMKDIMAHCGNPPIRSANAAPSPPAMNPEKLFDREGNLGEGGELMKRLYKKMFTENPGGVRIDHIVGLIDPWVYRSDKTPKCEDGAGRLFSSPEHPFLSKFAVATLEDLDYTLEADKEKRVKSLNDEQIRLYGRFVEKIVIAAAKECGLDKNAIVCEDLGTLTNPVVAVME